MPKRSAACSTVEPASTSSVCSSIVTLTMTSCGLLPARSLVKRAPPLLDMGDEFMLEMRQCRPQSQGRAVAQSAERVAENALAERLQLFQIVRRALSRLDPPQHFHHPVQPFAA